jgi:hypothetical protein
VNTFSVGRLASIFSSIFTPVVEIFNDIYSFRSYLILLILPVFYLSNSIIIHFHYGAFFLSSVDPEYFHLYNGIAIAKGNLAVEYIAHPATPLQYLIAFSARLIFLFQPGSELVTDFVNDPEKYIHAANIFMNLLIACSLFISGRLIVKYSGSTVLGFVTQLAPFGNTYLLVLSGRLIPESLMIIPFLFLWVMIIKTVFNGATGKLQPKDLAIFGIVTGFGIACKLSFIPILIIPIVLLKTSVKYLMRYLFYSILFVAIFAYPLWTNFNKSFSWIADMLSHSGKHGSGNNSFIDFSLVPDNFRYLISSDKLFFYLIVFSTIISVTMAFINIKKKDDYLTILVRATIAINASLILSIGLTLKHFALHYFMPFFIFKFWVLTLIVLILLRFPNISKKKAVKYLILSISFVIIIISLCSETVQTRKFVGKIISRYKKYEFAMNEVLSNIDKERPIIATSPYYGAPFIEFAHYNGYIMTAKLKLVFKPTLMGKYPNYFQYVYWSDKFYYWDEFVDMEYILQKAGSSFYIYIGPGKDKDYKEIEKRIINFCSKENISTEILFDNRKNGEKLIEFNIIGQTHRNEK